MPIKFAALNQTQLNRRRRNLIFMNNYYRDREIAAERAVLWFSESVGGITTVSLVDKELVEISRICLAL